MVATLIGRLPVRLHNNALNALFKRAMRCVHDVRLYEFSRNIAFCFGLGSLVKFSVGGEIYVPDILLGLAMPFLFQRFVYYFRGVAGVCCCWVDCGY